MRFDAPEKIVERDRKAKVRHYVYYDAANAAERHHVEQIAYLPGVLERPQFLGLPHAPGILKMETANITTDFIERELEIDDTKWLKKPTK